MYIEFSLPGNIGTRVVVEAIKAEIVSWANQYGVPDSDYSQKTIKYTHRLGFNKQKHFTLFSMTWTPDIPYRIIDIENEKY